MFFQRLSATYAVLRAVSVRALSLPCDLIISREC